MCFLEFIRNNKDVIDCYCTLCSVILMGVLVTVTYLAFRKVRSQHLLIQWSTLISSLYDLKRLQFEIMLLAEKEKSEKIGIRLDEARVKVEKDVKLLQEKVDSLESELKRIL